MTEHHASLFSKCTVMLAAMLCLMGVGQNRLSAAQEGDRLQPNTVWKGEIRQDDEKFPTTIFIKERRNERIKGEIHFQTRQGMSKLTFQGNVVGSNVVVWITDRKEGNATFPGLYIGKLNGGTISGTWQVPSADQYDTFTVKLAE